MQNAGIYLKLWMNILRSVSGSSEEVHWASLKYKDIEKLKYNRQLYLLIR